MVMAGERFSKDQLDYLKSMEEFSQKFPGFELEIQGVEKEDEKFFIYCFNEDENTKMDANGEASAAKGKKRRGDEGENVPAGPKKGKGAS